MDYLAFSPCVRYANILSLKEDYLQPLLAYDHRLLYVREGRMRVEFSEGSCALSAGDLLIFPPASPYRFTFYAGEERRYVLVNFDFDSAAWGRHSRHPVEARHFDGEGVFSRWSRRLSAGSAICTAWRSAPVCWRISAA